MRIFYICMILTLLMSVFAVDAVCNVRLTNDPSDSQRPVITTRDGRWAIVVWQDNRDGNYEIYWRRFSVIGEPLTPEIRVTNTPDPSVRPDISCDGYGRTYLVWQEGENANGVGTAYFTILDSLGVRILPADLQLETFSGDVRIATNFEGTSAVIWHHFAVTNQDVVLRHINNAGTTFCEKRFNKGTIPAINKKPSVAMDHSTAAIYWRDMDIWFNVALYEGAVNSSCQSGSGVMYNNSNAENPDADAAPVGSGGILFVNFELAGRIHHFLGGQTSYPLSSELGNATLPRVATDGSKGFVTWRDTRDGNNEIYMCRFIGETNETGDIRLTADNANSDRPDITAPNNQEGEWLVVWQDNRDGNWEIYMSGLDIRGYGALSGFITEKGTSLPMEGANITILQNYNVVTTITTDQYGRYLTPLLPAGIYGVRVEKESYKVLELSGIEVTAGLPISLDVELVYEWFSFNIDPFGSDDDPTDLLAINISLENISERNAVNVVASIWADGVKLDPSINVSEIPIGATSPAFKRSLTVERDWRNRIVKCVVESVNGQEVGLEENVYVSVMYPIRPGGLPYAIERDAYSFTVPSSSLCDLLSSIPDPSLTTKLLLQSVGLCLGMSSSSAAYFEDPSLKPIPGETYDMLFEDEMVMDEIYSYTIFQIKPLAAMACQAFESTSNKVARIKDMITNNKVPLLYMYPSITGPKHCVAVYRLTEAVTGEGMIAKVRLYDNNKESAADKSQTAIFDLHGAGSFAYGGYNECFVFSAPHLEGIARPVLEWIKEANIKFAACLFERAKNSIFHACPVTALITDNYGRRIGFLDDTTFVNEIPGATAEFYIYAENDSAAFYEIPNDLELEIEYSGSNSGFLESQIILPISPGTAYTCGHDSVAITDATKAYLSVSDTSSYLMSVDEDGNGLEDYVIAPTYDNVYPTAPDLLFPTGSNNYFNEETLQFQWSKCFDVDGDSISYHVIVSNDSLFLSIIADTTTADTLWNRLNDFPEGFYFWKTIALDSRGLQTESLSIETFVIANITGDITPTATNDFYISQNFPNPFNPVTTISFGLKEPGHVSLCIYDPTGVLVMILVDEYRKTGTYSVIWDGTNRSGYAVASGVYFCHLRSSNEVLTRKLILLR